MKAVLVGKAELDKDTVRGAAGLDGMDGNTVAGLLAGKRWMEAVLAGSAELDKDTASGRERWMEWVGWMGARRRH